MGIKSGGDYMPANPHQCRLYASRFFALAKNARSWEARQIFAEMAETWNQLAAEAVRHSCHRVSSQRLNRVPLYRDAKQSIALHD